MESKGEVSEKLSRGGGIGLMMWLVCIDVKKNEDSVGLGGKEMNLNATIMKWFAGFKVIWE